MLLHPLYCFICYPKYRSIPYSFVRSRSISGFLYTVQRQDSVALFSFFVLDRNFISHIVSDNVYEIHHGYIEDII